jgi:hypothetical protein
MAGSDEEVEAYLAFARVPESQKPEAARLFARSMAHELAASLAEWEATARRLEQWPVSTGAGRIFRPTSGGLFPW